MSPEASFIWTYGMYLANGGTREQFLDMTRDDVQIMYTTMIATQKKNTKDVIDGIIGAFSDPR